MTGGDRDMVIHQGGDRDMVIHHGFYNGRYMYMPVLHGQNIWPDDYILYYFVLYSIVQMQIMSFSFNVTCISNPLEHGVMTGKFTFIFDHPIICKKVE